MGSKLHAAILLLLFFLRTCIGRSMPVVTTKIVTTSQLVSTMFFVRHI